MVALQNYSASALRVNIAEGPIHSAHGISLGDIGKHGIVESTVATGRTVEEGESVCKSVLAVLDVLVLPDPPNAIDLSVVDCVYVRDDP
jgi:hypothetical protein